MEGGFLNQKGSGGRRGVKEKNKDVAAKDGVSPSGETVVKEKQSSLVDTSIPTAEMDKLSSLDDTTVLRSFPPLSKSVTTTADNALWINTLELKKLMNFFRSRKFSVIWSIGLLRVCKSINILFVCEDGLAIEWNSKNLIELLQRESDEFVLNNEGDKNDSGVISLKCDLTIKVHNETRANWLINFIETIETDVRKTTIDMIRGGVLDLIVGLVNLTSGFNEGGCFTNRPRLLKNFLKSLTAMAYSSSSLSEGRSSYARVMIELQADVELKDNIVVCACCKVFGHVHEECPKNIDAGATKNLKKTSHTPKGISVGQKMGFKPKQVFQPIFKKSTANTSGKKVNNSDSTKVVSKSNPFEVLTSVDNDADLGTNGAISNSVDRGTNNVSSSNTPIGENIDKIEQQIYEGKLRFVDDDWNPLVPTPIMESDKEVEVVFNETANLRISTSGKNGSNKGYGTNSLLKQWWDSYLNNDDYDPYDDDMYENHDMSEHLQSICDDIDIMVLDAMISLPTCTGEAAKHYENHANQIKLMHFLMGLDDVYQPIRSNILTREPLPLVKTAFAVVSREESHQNVTSIGNASKAPSIIAFAAKDLNHKNFFDIEWRNPKRPDDEGRVPSNDDGTDSSFPIKNDDESGATSIRECTP
nr:hypothetical protein [Tanacetum cinerariifolium]